MDIRCNRAFTLTELIFVIAILGVLVAVALASVNTNRAEGDDAGVLASFDNASTQASLYQTNNGTYGFFSNGKGAPATCPTPNTSGSSVFDDITVETSIASALNNSPGGITLCMASSTAYAAEISRPDKTNSPYWCIDSTGAHCGVMGPISGPSCGTCTTTK